MLGLGPLEVAAVPGSLGQAVAEYQAARDNREEAFQFRVFRAAKTTVLPSLRELTRSPIATFVAACERVRLRPRFGDVPEL